MRKVKEKKFRIINKLRSNLNKSLQQRQANNRKNSK